jgi:hypothetical protein
LGLCATAVVGAVALVACITIPPADLPKVPDQRPTIVRASVAPPASIPLLEWPDGGEFLVPVQVASPGEPFFYSVFVDYIDFNSQISDYNMGAGPPDGGTTVVSFHLRPPFTGSCPHLIQFLVAHGFVDSQHHSPDSVGGDEVDWYYTQGGGPSGCPLLEAGSGAQPDAASDANLIPPSEAGPLPEGGDF